MTKRIAQEGLVPFNVPAANKPCHTWYRIIGDLSSSSTPLVTLHGGPGACHEYLLPLRDLNVEHCIPIIFYDQIGNGHSTRLREKDGDEGFWTEELFRAELDNLIDHLDLRFRGFDILGQSWGGMLASKYAALHPEGLRKLVLADTCASVKLLLQGTNVLRAQLPNDVKEVLDKCEKEGNIESEEYEQACVVFYKRHLCRLDPWPKEVEAALGHLKEDPTVYKTM
jgi:L-proline amide hydrolase